MLPNSPQVELPALLHKARDAHIIDDWKDLGSIVMLRRSDSNFYVKASEVEATLRKLGATC